MAVYLRVRCLTDDELRTIPGGAPGAHGARATLVDGRRARSDGSGVCVTPRPGGPLPIPYPNVAT